MVYHAGKYTWSWIRHDGHKENSHDVSIDHESAVLHVTRIPNNILMDFHVMSLGNLGDGDPSGALYSPEQFATA